MLYTNNYHLNIVEGSDLVNPMSVDNPNYQAIDATMYANECASVGTATELKTGTVHALTRTKNNQTTFKFRATSRYALGDTFTVDGSAVTAQYVDGTTLKDGCYIIGSEVICTLNGTQLTIYATYIPEANNVPFDDANVPYTASTVQEALNKSSNAQNITFTGNTTIKQEFTDFMVVDTVTQTGNTIEVGAWDITVPVPSKTGYTCIGILGYAFTRVANNSVSSIRIEGSDVRIRGNNQGSRNTQYNVNLDLLWVKTNVL